MSGQPDVLCLLPYSAREAVRRIQQKVQGSKPGDRRATGRAPFFQPVTITRRDGTELIAFTRDFSPQGIGLLHDELLEPQEVWVQLPWEEDTIELHVMLCWSADCGNGWFGSGGRILDPLARVQN